VLSNNEILAVLGDRPYGTKTVPATLFGTATEIPRGPMRLSVLSGAPIVGALSVIGSGLSRYQVRCFDPMYPPDRRNVSSITNYLRQVTDMLEGMILSRPECWFAFEDIWKKIA